MDIHTLTRDLNLDNGSKIVMLVADGLGGLPMSPGGLTELETAKTQTWINLPHEVFKAQAFRSNPASPPEAAQDTWDYSDTIP